MDDAEDGSISFVYCPRNPEKHGTELYGRLAADDRFDVQSPYCWRLCTTVCDPGLYAFVGSGEGSLVRGATEGEFLDALEEKTGLDLSEYRDAE